MNPDLTKLTEELFDRDVMLCIRTNSPTFVKYGKQIRGKLKSMYKETKNALKILYKSLEREIPVEDIEYIIEDRYK
jgi:hypothetical protein